MGARLHLKIGVVAERDRLASSADTVLVTEPTTGSRARSKGGLYIVATADPGRGRGRDAAALVAETIRREYFYDESAGIPVCLEKAFRSANRRLRSQREGHGLVPGAIGLAVAVIRSSELYLATSGGAEAYLVRQARLLLPELGRGEGLPANADPRVDIWRGEIAVGDSLVLVASRLVEVVGTEEFKNALVTLHPQSAVEHLHHLFVAGGGDGPDAVLAIEATEVALTRPDHRLVPVGGAVELATFGDGGTLEMAEPPGANAAQSRTRDAREQVGGAFHAVVDRVTDVMPQRRPGNYRRIAPPVSRRETQRRAAVAIIALLGFVLVAGVGLWYLGDLPTRDEQLETVTSAEQALSAADGRVEQVLGAGGLLTANAEEATQLLEEAWEYLDAAATAGVSDAELAPRRAEVATGLDQLRAVSHTDSELLLPAAQMGEGVDPTGLVLGPDGAAYTIDATSDQVLRLDLDRGDAVTIIEPGQGPGSGIGRPTLLSVGGPELLIVDHRGGLWRWLPSDDTGRGTLGQVRVGGDTDWGDDVRDVATYLLDADQGRYNLYVVDPSERQLLRYQPTADGSGFSSPSGYLATASDVSNIEELVIDGDVYALTSEGLERYDGGRRDSDFGLQDPPDGEDLRPGHAFETVADLGARRQGRLYVWDSEHARIVAYGKQGGGYLEQFLPLAEGAPFADLRGMFVVDQGEDDPPLLYWLTPEGLRVTILEDVGLPDDPNATDDPDATDRGEEPTGNAEDPAETDASDDPDATDDDADPTSGGGDSTADPGAESPEPTSGGRSPRPTTTP
ncbi:hypothetical protein BH20CHL6_BH20CHL6_00130 [soil metagenome]